METGKQQIAESAGGFIGNRVTTPPPAVLLAVNRAPRRPRAPSRAERRATRRLDRRTEKITAWWSAVPTPAPAYFLPADLEHTLRLSMRQIAPALRALGWLRRQRRIGGEPRAIWLPPGSPIRGYMRGMRPVP